MPNEYNLDGRFSPKESQVRGIYTGDRVVSQFRAMTRQVHKPRRTRSITKALFSRATFVYLRALRGSWSPN